MKQLMAFLHAIKIRNTTKEYYHLAAHAKFNGFEMTPLDEILGVTSKDAKTPFDSKSDAAMERRAFELLEERKRLQNVR